MNMLFDTRPNKEEDTKYSRSVSIPQYLPKNKKPHIGELCDTTKCGQLIKRINESNLPEEEKEFLRIGARRHIVFNYAKIADYYAHASKEMQELMEESALVIIDMDDAIANGYVKMSEKIQGFVEESRIQRGMK